MNDKYKDYIGFGVAGNFALHLDQAGEALDFLNVKVDDEKAPKGIFPFYLPKYDSFLGTYPLSSKEIKYPQNIKDGNLQMEPEVALVCEIIYNDDMVEDLIIKSFCAYNDCSIRKPNAEKISEKKNWGNSTKGMASNTISIDKFTNTGIMDSYYIASFLKRDGNIYEYGKDSSVLTYNYFYGQLKQWMILKLNTQKDEGPLEDLSLYLSDCGKPKNMIISIGATSYTSFGENTFLQKGDEVFVCVYDKNINSFEEIKEKISKNNLEIENSSILHQRVT